jgi:ribosomal-protein-alanine N-acetyltransferase
MATTDPVIRNYTENDFLAVLPLEMGEKRNAYSAAVSVRQAGELFPDTFFVADIGGTVAGYAIGAHVRGTGKEAWVLRLAVKEPFRGNGIGILLMEQVIAALDAGGAEVVFLSVSPQNAPAVAIYRKLGFVTVCCRKEYFGDGEDRDIMRLRTKK